MWRNALQRPLKHQMQVRSSLLIYDISLFPTGTHLITVGRRSHIMRSLAALHINDGRYFPGDVFAVVVVYDVLHCNDHRFRVAGGAVVTIINSNEAYLQGRKYMLEIITGFQIVPAETRKVF